MPMKLLQYFINYASVCHCLCTMHRLRTCINVKK